MHAFSFLAEQDEALLEADLGRPFDPVIAPMRLR